MFINKNYPLFFLEISIYFLPLSFLIGTLIVNINLLIFIFLAITYLILNKIKVNFNLSNLSLFTFYIIFIISSYKNINQIGIENFLKSIFLLKYFLLYILFETLFNHRKLNLKYFFNICLILSILLSLDLALQFFYGKNILGYEPWEGRITGIFRDEAIAGSYIQKVFALSLVGLFNLFYPLNKKNALITSTALFIIIFGSYIASNRISFFILISFILSLIFFHKVFRKNLALVFILLLPIFVGLYQNNEEIKKKYHGFFLKSKSIILNIKNIVPSQSEINNNLVEKNTSPSKIKRITNHEKLFITGLKSFEESMILGNGYKSFRFKCQILSKKSDKFLCSTHTHNYHLEVLHDTGLLGFIFLSIFAFSLLVRLFNKIKTKSLDYNSKIILSLLIINFLFIIFPLKSTGSLFTSWNGTLLWLTVALLNYENQKTKTK
jgi:O-antigen ligase